MDNSLLLKNIETCRLEMIMLCKKYGMSSEHVIDCSKKLDLLLNEYEQRRRGIPLKELKLKKTPNQNLT